MSESNAFMTLHKGLLREAPGSDRSTLKAMTATGLSGQITIADMGCGPGAAALLSLQAFPEAEVVAIDHHQPYLDTLEARAHAAGLAARLETRQANMAAPGLPPASLDLIICEGALYFLGVTEGLRQWAPLLRPGGHVIFSEAVWLANRPPEEARLFWMEYPAMTTMPGVETRIAEAGFELVADFLMPPEDWQAYLGPLGTRAESLRPGADDVMRRVIDGAEEEAKLFERHGDTYGYAYFVTRLAA
ncbi:class I SAM-dependent methyltransferase [Algicella marina]|uniref:Methyltransferase domain-containing protein n=1 Tax=Algicella marina TaxID=2683284 RepID=A0A6P1T0X6_9RHOB|nr:class I SAM-dependent methyltransferase [Algicella marina]QHQ35096.1 methyltransferase domain-containing protein [Algicella marina]